MTRGTLVALLAVAVAASAASVTYGRWSRESAEPIRVGVLHSLSGTMAISEREVVDATRLAIEELNEAGGVLGRPVEAVVRDGASDWPTFAREAEQLIVTDRVAVIFGCWTSASRKHVKAVVEKHRHLLFYPVQYEGLEQSPNIVYTGAAPNQQIIPAVKWSFDHLGRRFFLVGSDYIFPRTANAIIRHVVDMLGGEVVGEEYVLLGSTDLGSVVRSIVGARPDVLLNTINGDSNVAFFRALREAGLTPDRLPTVSFSVAEAELRTMSPRDVAGHYAAWNYFQSVDRSENSRFVARLKRRFGDSRVVSDPMEAAYVGVHLWALAATDAGSIDASSVRQALADQSFPAPQGVVYVDGETQHTWKIVRIGKIKPDAQFEIVWDSGKPVRPVPYPFYRSRAGWDSFVQTLFKGWGGQWANPGPGT